jgi:hypothetical protein
VTSPQAILDPFDRELGAGSGSKADDWLDGESIFHNEWGSQAATTFNPSEGDANGHSLSTEKQHKLERLYELQNGKGRTTRKTEIRQSHINNDAETFMSVLELPEAERRSIRQILDNLEIDSRKFSSGYRYEKIILTICSLVADEALSTQPEAKFEQRLFFTDEFRELMESCNMSSSDHRKLRPIVREKADYFD